MKIIKISTIAIQTMMLPLVSLMFLVFSSLSGCYTAPMLQSKSFNYKGGTILVRSTPEECSIELLGSINLDTLTAYRLAVAEAEQRDCKAKWVILSSGGGNVLPAIDIGKDVRSRGWNTQIHYGNSCSSACGIIFAGGVKRAISSSMFPTHIGFHQISKKDGSGSRSCIREVEDSASQTLLSYLNYMLPSEGAEAFFNKAMETDCKKIQFINSEEAKNLGISTHERRDCKACALIP